MTNIATKNGAVIVKDGGVAENCGCCGEWYCYGQSCASRVAAVRARLISPAEIRDDEVSGPRWLDAPPFTREMVADYANLGPHSFKPAFPVGRSATYVKQYAPPTQWRTLDYFGGNSCTRCDYTATAYTTLAPGFLAQEQWAVSLDVCESACSVSLIGFRIPARNVLGFCLPDIEPSDSRIKGSSGSYFLDATDFASYGACVTGSQSVVFEEASGGTPASAFVNYGIAGTLGSTAFTQTQSYSPGAVITFSISATVNSSFQNNSYSTWSDPIAAGYPTRCRQSVAISGAFTAEVEVTVI